MLCILDNAATGDADLRRAQRAVTYTLMRPFPMKELMALLAVTCSTVALGGQGPSESFPLVEAVECRPRGGLPNAFAKLATGGEVRVAYIGGSITAANGWRPMTTRWLAQTYPDAKVVEINAAIGGTGSDLGVFRFRRDVLEHKPALVFIEFAVNDGGFAPDLILRTMEGMVRQARSQDSTIDICFVYTLTDGMVTTLAAGKFPRSASAMEKVADYYGIPSIHMGMEVVRLHKEGKLVLRAAPRTAEEKAALSDKIVFSADGVHPHAETGHKLYLEAIVRSFQKMRGGGTAGARPPLPPLTQGNYENARLVPVSRATMSAGWRRLDPQKDALAGRFSKYLPDLHVAAQAGESLSLRFRGTYVGFMDLLGPDCGQVVVSIDDGPPVRVARFDAYSTYHRIGSFAAGRDLPAGVHTVKVTLDGTPLDKAAILSRLNNRMDDPKRFEGLSWYVSQVMLIGDLE